jgi:hypothetical protein
MNKNEARTNFVHVLHILPRQIPGGQLDAHVHPDFDVVFAAQFTLNMARDRSVAHSPTEASSNPWSTNDSLKNTKWERILEDKNDLLEILT